MKSSISTGNLFVRAFEREIKDAGYSIFMLKLKLLALASSVRMNCGRLTFNERCKHAADFAKCALKIVQPFTTMIPLTEAPVVEEIVQWIFKGI